MANMQTNGSQGAVAAGHPLTAEAAAEILRAGGNAYDAIIAAHFAACVVEPVLASLGGGGFLLSQPAAGNPKVFDFFVQTPLRKNASTQVDFQPIVADFGETQQEFHMGLGAIATPGSIKGMFDIHRQLGTLPMRELVQPAVEYARGGVRVNRLQAYIFQVVSPILLATPQSRALFSDPNREDTVVGENYRLKMPELADTFEHLARERDDLFYRGEMGALLARQTEHFGHLTRDDLASYSVVVRDPLMTRFRGQQLVMNPPPSAGGVLINFALQLMQALPLKGREQAASLCDLVQVMAATSEARLEADVWSEEAIANPLLDPSLIARYQQEVLGRRKAHRGTTHISVIDADHNLAAMTVSNGEGCGYILTGCGVILNNMLGEEDLNPHGFNQWRVNHRMTSMMSPSIINFADGRSVALGSGGSNRIRTAILQTIIRLVEGRMPLEAAIASPRLHLERDFLDIEPGFSEQSLTTLLNAYPDNKVWHSKNLFFGGVHAVELEHNNCRAVGDARRGGAALTV